jgi:hypothetical protein
VNPAYAHLLVNHVPIVGAALSIPLLLIALWRREEPGVFLAAVVVVVIAGVGALAAERSGHAAEGIVEDLPGVEERLVEEHEERGEAAMWVALASAALGVVTLALVWRRSGPVPAWCPALLLVAALATTTAMAWTALSGGEIRHPEIHADAADHDEHDEHEHD